jgi:hypothetical protein
MMPMRFPGNEHRDSVEQGSSFPRSAGMTFGWPSRLESTPSGLKLFLLATLIVLLTVTPVFASSEPPDMGAAETIRVRDVGDYMLVRYSTDGTILRRYTGFDEIADVAPYDASTVLVVERSRGTISALSLDGKILWHVSLSQPRCVQVLGPDRFLVCQDHPAKVAEIDRAGHVLWEVSAPLTDVSGAVRLPDGDTAVVEGRNPTHAVHVLDRDGKILWTGTESLALPRGLALLPSGEIVTSGFDTGRLMIFEPYTERTGSISFCCHAESVSTTPQGDILSTSGERQVVSGWHEDGRSAWTIATAYPPRDVEMLADGTLLVSMYKVPDRTCLNATKARQRPTRPLAPYWRSILTGLGAALLFTLLIQWPVIRSWGSRSRSAAAIDGGRQDAPPPSPLSVWRRLEVLVYLLVVVAVAVMAGAEHARLLAMNQVPGWAYLGWIGLGGVALCLLQVRVPCRADDWRHRMANLDSMSIPGWRMWILWLVGLALIAAGFESVFHQRGGWEAAYLTAGLLLLAGGSLEQAKPGTHHVRPWAMLAAVLVIGGLFVLRVYRLETIPPNLHHDMAQWTAQSFRFMDGDVSTPFTNGWAEVPMIGYLWTGLVSVLGGRSLSAARFPSVIGSLLAIAAVFLLVRRLFDTPTAIVAVILLGFDQTFLHFSRIQAYMDPVPFHVVAVLGLVAGLQTGRYEWFVLAGLAGGYSGLTYHAGRITPPALLGLGTLILLRYPRTITKRWPGLVLLAVTLLGLLGVQALVYAEGRAEPLGRVDQFPFVHQGVVNYAEMIETLRRGLPRVFGSFWFYGDSSTQYGGRVSFYPPIAAFLGMTVVAALLRLWDLRAFWVIAWGSLILFVGGVLTIDPPFWPRLVLALVPASIAASIAIGSLYRGAVVAGGRVGAGIGAVAILALLALNGADQLDSYRYWVQGMARGATVPGRGTQWVQGIMGRDIQTWGQDAMIYIVAPNPMEHSCTHPTMVYYAYDSDVRDARDIGEYIPFDDARTVVVYALVEMKSAMQRIRTAYPQVEEKPFSDNLGRHVFSRFVIRSAK